MKQIHFVFSMNRNVRPELFRRRFLPSWFHRDDVGEGCKRDNTHYAVFWRPRYLNITFAFWGVYEVLSADSEVHIHRALVRGIRGLTGGYDIYFHVMRDGELHYCTTRSHVECLWGAKFLKLSIPCTNT